MTQNVKFHTIDEFELYKAIFENNSQAMAIIESDSTVSMVNDAFCRTSGFSREEVIGSNWMTNVAKEEVERLRKNHQLRLEGKQDVINNYEFIFYTKTGEKRYGMISASLILPSKKTIASFTDITELKRIEEARRISEEHYRQLVEHAHDIVYSITKEGLFTYASPNWTEKLGHTTQQILGHSFTEFIHPDDAARLSSLIRRNYRTGIKLSGIEYRIRHLDGHWLWYTSSTSPVFDHEGHITSLVGITHDITEQKRIKEAQLKSEALFNAVVRTIPDLVWLKDPDGIYLSCNPMFERFFGVPMKKIIGKTDYDFVPKELADSFRNFDLIAIQKGGPSNNEEWVTFANEKHKTLLDTIKTPMYTPDGQLIGILGIARDITERKRAEEAIHNSQTKLAMALKIAHLGPWEYDVMNDLFIFNDAFYSLYKTNAAEVGGYQMSSVEYTSRYVHPEDRELVRQEIRIIQLPGNPELSCQFEHRVIFADGTYGTILVYHSAIRDEAGKVIKSFGINLDITQRKKVEQELMANETRLRDLNASKDKFFSIIAHDLRSPFSIIVGLSELLTEQGSKMPVDELKQNLKILYNTAGSTFVLLENLLEWSQLQRGTLKLKIESIALNDFIQNLYESFIQQAENKQINLSFQLSQPIILNADPNLLHSILRNLLTNAIKFSNDKGKVELLISQSTGKEVLFEISDSGIGMPPEILNNLFQIDKNVCRPGTRNESSSGLGLILCKEFVEQHNGKIWAKSSAGYGSTFYFTIPESYQSTFKKA